MRIKQHSIWGKAISSRALTLNLSDGRIIGYAEYGDPNGMPVLYFHGLPGSRLEAGHYHNVATANHCRLIGIDRPGMGLSSPDKNRSILSWANDVTDFADQLKLDKFSIIGHSGGGPFVAACAHELPERLIGCAIVSGMAPFEHPESHTDMPKSRIFVNKLIKTIPWCATAMMGMTNMILKKPNKMMDQMVKQLPEVDQVLFRDPIHREAIINSTVEAFRHGSAGPAQEMKLLLSQPWGFELQNITVPMSIWHGELDIQGPTSHAKIYASSIPNAQLNIFENEGHHSLIKNHFEEILLNVSVNNSLINSV